MIIKALMAPVFIQVALTFFLLFYMGRTRVKWLATGEKKLKDIALGGDVWPAHVTKIANSFHNQLQIPILFYAAVLFAIALVKVNYWFISLAWIFAGSRLVHAYVACTSNHVIWRFRWFGLGALALIGMWGMLAFRIMTEGA
ncbi:MAG: MAPEG family protein [Hyphomicrobiales bacterium]|nr:MAPEG family protein [Hyphomicrobiales bacterium]